MDFGNAALLIGAIFGITEILKQFIPSKFAEDSRVKGALAVGVGFAATFLVGATSWANEQVIGSVPLDKMSVADKVLVAIFATGGAALVQRGLKAVSNVGDNQPTNLNPKYIPAPGTITNNAEVYGANPPQVEPRPLPDFTGVVE